MADVPDVSDQVPQAWVMCANHYMDNCSGTNKSKFMVGGLGLLVPMGHLAAIRLKFMITGHTKFESDVVAQKTDGRFNANDRFGTAAHESEAEARHLAGGNAAVGDDMSGDSSGGARLGADDARLGADGGNADGGNASDGDASNGARRRRHLSP
ncbi:hypothetical protein M885DRAFT_576250 [Pelagophyceae sp. CCMP2097]|nr:hypothetical protein M885DRAFT_576250 [Pelagophyceae sp. CCMP2097]